MFGAEITAKDFGVRGDGDNGTGVIGISHHSDGVFGLAADNRSGVVGLTRAGSGAGFFGIHLDNVGGEPSRRPPRRARPG